MAVVGLVPHHARPAAERLARQAVVWLHEHGHEVRVPAEDAASTGLGDVAYAGDEFGRGLDLALSVGGDGTMLRAVSLVCGAGVPVLGVNVGHLGYLVQVDPEELVPALERCLGGDYAVEERMTLDIRVCIDGEEDLHRTALNEAVIEKTVSGHTVRFSVTIDGEFFTTYAADGVIVATPTGSTAYNLSARGPIVSPALRALLMTPVSPHMLFDRSLVLDGDETIELEVLPGPPAAAVIDGRAVGTVPAGGVVRCRAGADPARFVRLSPRRDFHRILKAKFGLSDR